MAEAQELPKDEGQLVVGIDCDARSSGLDPQAVNSNIATQHDVDSALAVIADSMDGLTPSQSGAQVYSTVIADARPLRPSDLIDMPQWPG